jgi:hypothetical protein
MQLHDQGDLFFAVMAPRGLTYWDPDQEDLIHVQGLEDAAIAVRSLNF